MKTLTKNKLFTAVFALFMTICALLGIVATVPHSAKADDTTSEIPDFSSYNIEKEYDGSAIGGKYFRVKLVEGSEFPRAEQIFNIGLPVMMDTSNDWYIDCGGALAKGDEQLANIGFYVSPNKGLNFLDFYISKNYSAEPYGDISNATKTISTSNANILIFELEKAPEDNKTDINEPENPTLGDWITNAGDNVSVWLSDNVGLAITGSTVIAIAAVIIVVMILRRR